MSRWIVVVSGPQMLDDIRRATDDQLSFREAIAEVVQTDYMIGPQIRRDPYHVNSVRMQLTRNLGVRFDDIKDEIFAAFKDLISTADHGRDPDFKELTEQFTMHVILGGQILNLFPMMLKPIIGRFLTRVPSNIKRMVHHTGPLVQAQLDQEKSTEGNSEAPTKNNLISWLLEEAKGEQRTVQDIALRLLTINFASIHTTSMALTNILYDLATYPEYVEPMREEVERIIESEGWTKSSMGKMRKLDSFVKESQRLAIGSQSIRRKTLKDFTFSNGLTVPADTHIVVATRPTHLDEGNYEDPDKFNGFRFAHIREAEGEGVKHQMVYLSPDYVLFGTGRHACPGRFFAVNELKAMLAFVLQNYDVKLSESERPKEQWLQGQCSPNKTAKLLFRKRVL
ncbi:Cytochrome P450 monooxygenase 103 [Psilocybe cubensis]|uniref:Cytochrome P450 monooxygenase 103 n=1 Tax=Psilocybe cubensis TaxID=181762 RepID=A0ACB8GQ50_PSICU|nr:Cytochrome P450 monooxygenase 103 [Psilocybe cubensis]KAH9477542.1 Cytochrome P450 monooxygenase 103 [Psilocybe cubensis]